MRQVSLVKGKQDNAIIVHITHLPKLIRNLQKTMQDVQNNNKNDSEQFDDTMEVVAGSIIVDDEQPGLSRENPVLIVDEWDINAAQAHYRKELALVYVERLKAQLNTFIEGLCERMLFWLSESTRS